MWSEPLSRKIDRDLRERLGAGRTCGVGDMPQSAEAFFAWSLQRAYRRPVLWIGDGPRTLQLMHRNMLTLAPPDGRLLYYPAWETLPGKRAVAADAEIEGHRLAVLLQLGSGGAPALVATCMQALMQKTLDLRALAETTITVTAGAEVDFDLALKTAELAGFDFTPEVSAKGQASVRGGIMDIWPSSEPFPLRIEFAGSTLESIRTFNPLDQRSIERRPSVRIAPAGEWHILRRHPQWTASLLDHLAGEAIVVWSHDDDIRGHAGLFAEALTEAGAWDFATAEGIIRTQIEQRASTWQIFLAPPEAFEHETTELDFRPMEGTQASPSGLLEPDVMEQTRRTFAAHLAKQASEGRAVSVFFDTTGGLERFQGMQPEAEAAAVRAQVGPLSDGFRSDSLGILVVAESDLYGTRQLTQGRYDPLGRRAGPKAPALARVSDWTDMEPGDLVVHLEHGIGRYLGLREIVFDSRLQEVLAIEYADKARLYVPVSQAHLLTRYVGVGRRHAHVHRLGGKQWTREKAAAEISVRDLASSLLEVQAARSAMPGHAFKPDTVWQHQFEGAFPYQETEDQERAIHEVKADMENTEPMDRLVCGDAGYGKTEVAMRASFKTVMEGKQVAVLVPTTVLAQQHYFTFAERMTAYPIRVDMLSRFRTRTEHDAVVRGIRDGTVDVVIGTHSLLQPAVQFHDLGLVIIDEEQRFGVLHKEQFKQMRRLVDVLTLTATPIPRTLYMSLTGAKDLSTIQTPPQDRLTIETIVAQNTDEVIREAILRELNREGQVFYLHNRVHSIDHVRERLERLTPEARVAVAHGQMASSELEEVMQAFVRNEFDVLLCTTIIESGLDIPNANTILIDRADRFGMAELYQLRGRVGRSKHKAYAYMLLPVHAHIDPTARKRIQAIKQYSDHGAGFRLAMRDLEIRGAGNLLGAEQSGHIATVGFALYCQLLKRSVAQIKGEPAPPIVDVQVRLDFIDLSPAAAESESAAVIPAGYIDEERQRIGAYRRMAEAAFPQDVEALRTEFRDRYGPIPPALSRLLKIAALRIAAAHRSINTVEVKEDKLMLTGPAGYLMEGSRFPRLSKTSPLARLDEIIAHMRRLPPA